MPQSGETGPRSGGTLALGLDFQTVAWLWQKWGGSWGCGLCLAHPVSPHPEHQPSMVPKACSVLEEIFTFFSSCSETTVLARPDSHIFDGILLPVFIWNLFFIRTKTRDLPWWFCWILTQVLFITQHCSSPILRLCLTFSFLEVSS